LVFKNPANQSKDRKILFPDWLFQILPTKCKNSMKNLNSQSENRIFYLLSDWLNFENKTKIS
jgi:hypothetical protein